MPKYNQRPAMNLVRSWRQAAPCERLTSLYLDRPAQAMPVQNVPWKKKPHCTGNTFPETIRSFRPSRLPAVSNESIRQQSMLGVSDATRAHTREASSSPLAILPLSSLIRSLAVTMISSSSTLLDASMAILSLFVDSRKSLLNPDRNPVLGYLTRKTIYEQFCAGETPQAVRERIRGLKDMGYCGVILGYAEEVVLDGDAVQTLESEHNHSDQDHEVQQWQDGTMQTVELAEAGDFVALKFTGAGRDALRHLLQGLPLPAQLADAMTAICERCRERSVRLLVDAEQQAVQSTIDAWVLELQRRYNSDFIFRGRPSALVYNTYQAYLASTPATLSRHLAAAQNERFNLGVKLVRGAYLGSDPRHLIHQSKEETDRVYDGVAASLIQREYNQTLIPTSKLLEFPPVDLVLASHNRASIQKAQTLRNHQKRTGQPMIRMVYGQLQGMADNLSCELVQERKATQSYYGNHNSTVEGPRPYKYLVWGTVGQCTRYLLRRGQENRDAVSRTRDMRRAVLAELGRRAKEHFGLG